MKTGFIVEGKTEQFLDEYRKRFMKHGRDETPYVHTAENLLTDVMSGATWPSEAEMVYPGEFDPKSKFSYFTGKSVSFREFLAAQLGVEIHEEEAAGVTA